ncbi:MAG TPA: HAMP domain-containing sensor histidine kinase [Polyangiaceae bacterium]|nr:HAMP domain-containing sensor histidine kinase [Polyangiaceae bacterium]
MVAAYPESPRTPTSAAPHAIFFRDSLAAACEHGVFVKEAEKGERGGPLASHVSTLVEVNGLMDRMIRDLVDNAAIDAGRLAVALEPQSAANLVYSAAAVFEPVAKDRGQSLSVTPALADVSVEADATRAMQVLGNLLSNAIKFTPPAGSITVGFDAADEDVVFFVADTGPGVPPENVEHIFERFVGSRSSTGLGLGLFIAHHIIDAHGGHLWLDCTATTGATFRFTLRRTQ